MPIRCLLLQLPFPQLLLLGYLLFWTTHATAILVCSLPPPASFNSSCAHERSFGLVRYVGWSWTPNSLVRWRSHFCRCPFRYGGTLPLPFTRAFGERTGYRATSSPCLPLYAGGRTHLDGTGRLVAVPTVPHLTPTILPSPATTSCLPTCRNNG